jgi:hypothetical protein
MSRTQVHTPRKPVLAGIGATAVLVTAAALVPGSTPAEAATYTPPPAHAGFDYQIGGAYTPPAGVEVVSRDHATLPAPRRRRDHGSRPARIHRSRVPGNRRLMIVSALLEPLSIIFMHRLSRFEPLTGPIYGRFTPDQRRCRVIGGRGTPSR